MKRSAFALTLCLGLLGTTAWLIAHPVYAMTATVECRDGSTRTCKGESCTGSDAIPGGTNGWCQCTSSKPGTPADVQDCDQKESPALLPDAPPEN